ncbi:MAG: DsrE family protein [Campylobacterota bacterium]|nr:DsrE family protein [Campylobacterota bacterium]
MKKFIIILLISIGIAQAQDELAKVVYDLTTKGLANFELKVLKGIVANKAHYEGSLRELDVVVVIHGGAYKFFTKDPSIHPKFKDDKVLVDTYKSLAKRIKSMADTYDVEFLMCGAAMAKNKLKAKDIYSFVKIIPNSTIGLIDKQNEGYAYIPIKD